MKETGYLIVSKGGVHNYAREKPHHLSAQQILVELSIEVDDSLFDPVTAKIEVKIGNEVKRPQPEVTTKLKVVGEGDWK